MASHFGHVEIVRLLLSQANIDLNKKAFNKSALDSAKKNNHKLKSSNFSQKQEHNKNTPASHKEFPFFY